MSKPATNPDSTGLAQFPPAISLDSLLLASLIALPAKPLIAYAVFTPAQSLDAAQHLTAIEVARRSIIFANGRLPILESLLPSVQIARQSPILRVFAISSVDLVSQAHSNLNSLSFDGLVGKCHFCLVISKC